MISAIYGIDPGKSGAIVSISLSKGKLVEVIRMPLLDEDLSKLLNHLVVSSAWSEVWVERVPKFAGKNQSGASVATLFSNYRYIVGYLEGRGVTVNQVVPQVWMKPYRLRSSGWQMMNYNSRKKYLHEMSLENFHTDKKSLPRWAADAALIALYGSTKNK